ncbi:MAG TPA: AAA family ATPase, partial [Solirubrobacteraceae bacterium]|nr:AAA family ATPase [Solirubrobacteraceae bacterium]
MGAEIIGRRDELLVLESFLEAAPAGGQSVLIEGDAGIGKTVLWQEALRIAGERGFCVLRSRPTQSEAQVAFAAVGDLLAPALGGVLQRLAPVQRRALETALLMREPDGRFPDTRVLGLALLTVMRALAEERPVLVALDDAHWLDASSAQVLTFMLRRLDGAPVAVLATVRGQPITVPLELDRTFAAFRPLPIAPLSVGAIHRLLWGRLGIALPRPVIVRVHGITGGNPFFALELGRALVDGSGHVEDADVELPESLRAIVAQRLSALPASVRETLAAVAALAAPSVALLEALGGTSVDDVELAQRKGVTEFDGERIRFTHPLLAPACYEAMPLHRRRSLHERLAALDVDLEERARHLAIAATGPDEQVAAALDAAAAHARARGAIQAAADLSERAIALTPPDVLERINRRRITAAEHCRYAGDTKKAAILLEDVVGSSQPGRVRADALGRLAGARGMTEGFPVAARLLRRALSEPGLEPRQEVNLLCELAWVAHQGGDMGEGAGCAEAGLALAEQLADPATLAIALAAVAQMSFARAGRIRQDLLDRALELERTLDGGGYAAEGWWTWHAGLPMRLSPARVTLALLLGRSDRHAESRALWSALTAEAREHADPDVVRCLFHRAQTEMAAGAWDTATELCDDAIQLTRQIGLEVFEPLCLSILAEIDAYTGETEKARGTIPELLRIAETGMFRWAAFRLRTALAVLELSDDDAAASWRHAAQLLEDVEELDVYLGRLAGSAGIEALLAIGDGRRARRLLAQVEQRAAGGDTALQPLGLRCRGLLLASHDDYEPAIASLEEAARPPEPPQGVNAFELGRTLLALGTVQRRAQHKRAARESLERAVGIFERLGAKVWLERARSELRRIGGRIASDHEFSETERQIVELVVAGRRNSEVAAELSLSPNTVAWNLSKVYKKLGVRSRTELAARVGA